MSLIWWTGQKHQAFFLFFFQTQSDHNTFSPNRLWAQSASRRACPRPPTSTRRTGSGYSGEQWADRLIPQQCSSSPGETELTVWKCCISVYFYIPCVETAKLLDWPAEQPDTYWGPKVKTANPMKEVSIFVLSTCDSVLNFSRDIFCVL